MLREDENAGIHSRRRLTATKWPLDAGNDDGYYEEYLEKRRNP